MDVKRAAKQHYFGGKSKPAGILQGKHPDADAREKWYGRGLRQWGYLSANELRELYQLKPLQENLYWMPVNMTLPTLPTGPTGLPFHVPLSAIGPVERSLI